MKKLNKKVFTTIFLILSLFLIISIVVYNFQLYKKEYDSVYRNLNFIGEKSKIEFNGNKPVPKRFDNFIERPKDKELDNMMIMDYEVYTVKIKDNSINKIINHSRDLSDFDIEKIAKKIVNNKKEIKVGNLYNNKYAYNYKLDTITIINTTNINKRLDLVLVKSLLLLLGIEIIIYFISNKITQYITKPAQEAFDKQKDFIADASHELKTPLAVIMASADEINVSNKNSKYVENIKYESERMNKLIRNLLDLSKLENGITINNYKEENLSKIIEKICLTFEAVAFEHNIGISTNIEKNIIFKCSKDEIEKLISIILDNAIEHSYEKSEIIVNVNRIKNTINIEIINFGDPIKSGDEDKIFERFYRGDKSRKRESNHYGLGLAIAKKIVDSNNGIISAKSIGKKTTFEINFKK